MKHIFKFRFLICLVVFFYTSHTAFSQELFKRRAIYGELLGSGIIASINYDFRFLPGNDGFGLRIGAGGVPSGIVIPVGVNGLLGEKRLAFEYGVGLTAAIISGPISENLTFNSGSDTFGFIGYAKAGIRYTPKKNGLFINLNWNPIVNSEGINLGWFGLGLGYTWQKLLE